MSRKVVWTLFAVALGAFVVFLVTRWSAPLAGIESKGRDDAATVQYVALATSIVSLLTAIVGLLKILLDQRKKT